MQTGRTNRRRRKGSLEETLSYALHGDDSNMFSVMFRDRDEIKRDSLANFLKNTELFDIPLTRIRSIMRGEKVVWRKGQKEVSIKKAK